MRAGRTGVAVTAVALLWGALACGGGSGSEPEPAADRGSAAGERAAAVPLTATFTGEAFVDQDRPTSASPFAAAAESRTLQTRIAYPEPLRGELPLIVLAHGLTGDPAKFTELMTRWSEAGYVVAAPTFPRSTESQPGGAPAADANDVVNQPADVSFVIDEMLALNEDPASPLHGHIDAHRIGLAGHSLGGLTAYGVVFSSCCEDDRVDAVLFMAMAPPDLLDRALGARFDDHSVPTLVMVADGDFIYDASVDAYPRFAEPKWMVTLHGGDLLRHATPFEDAPDPADELVYATTTAFWDMQLKDDPDAESRMTTAARPTDGSATLEVG